MSHDRHFNEHTLFDSFERPVGRSALAPPGYAAEFDPAKPWTWPPIRLTIYSDLERLNMPFMTLDDIQTSGLQPPEEPRPTLHSAFEQAASNRDAELEAYDFIARCVLEKDSQFFDG
jgi:hypothetical protein